MPRSQREGEFDLVLCGRNSVDADTGQVGPELAALLDTPFVTAARHLAIDPHASTLHARSESDDGFAQLRTTLPAVVSCAERLIDPSKVDPDRRAQVDGDRIARRSAAELGAGPWGAAGSPTTVGRVRVLEHDRARLMWADAPLPEQVAQRSRHCASAAPLRASSVAPREVVPGPHGLFGHPVAVVVEPDRDRFTAELLGAAAQLAERLAGHVVAFGTGGTAEEKLGAWGADLVVMHDADVEERVADALADWAIEHDPWAVLAPSTTWGREVAARAAARLGAGLTGDAVELDLSDDGRLVELEARVRWRGRCRDPLLVSGADGDRARRRAAHAGTAPVPARDACRALVRQEPRRSARPDARRRSRRARRRDARSSRWVRASTRRATTSSNRCGASLGAELGATRKVTDLGWLPRARQIGITGRAVAPRLLVSIGAGGKFNHSVGFRNAGHVLAINPEPGAPIFGFADVGIVAPWDDAVPLLVDPAPGAV